MTFELLTRPEFVRRVFARDKYKCVVCGKSGDAEHLDAHHIVERRLFSDGGYYIDNGATLCGEHHKLAETTEISCDELRALCGIKSWHLPSHLEDPIDKWGNPILPTGKRMRGELYDSIAAHLPPSVLALFTEHVKYPRTYHLPWSPGISEDDRVNRDLSLLQSGPVVVTAKMDGECTTIYRDYIHARSTQYRSDMSRAWVKSVQACIGPDIPEGWRVCGENLWAKHSIKYNHLSSYFQVFSVWDRSRCLSWEQTCEWAALLGLKTVPVMYTGPWDEQLIRRLYTPVLGSDPCEGYVVRTADEFSMRDFRLAVNKYVRAGHVQTTEHWRHQALERNELDG